MKKNFYRQMFFLILLFPWFCLAGSNETYLFNATVKKVQFEQMIGELRCLVCQNQSIADSNAPLAKDLRQLIYKKIENGESEQCIKKYLVSRYGEYILLKPSFSPRTYLLWLGPFTLFLIISIKLIFWISRIETKK